MAQKERPTEGSCCSVIHRDVVAQVKARMPEEGTLFALADFFKMFSESTRIRILWALSEAEMCVCDISSVLNMSQSAISHQLRLLKASNLVKNRREGKVVYYSLCDEHVQQVFMQGLVHINEDVE